MDRYGNHKKKDDDYNDDGDNNNGTVLNALFTAAEKKIKWFQKFMCCHKQYSRKCFRAYKQKQHAYDSKYLIKSKQ